MGSQIRGFNLINSPVMNQKPKNASFRLLAGLAALTLGTVAAQAQAVPPVLAHWDFEQDFTDKLGTLHGTAEGGASLKDGKLVLDG